MVNINDVLSIIRWMTLRLVENYQPERIILFGSVAYGNPEEDSDIDLLIVKETDDTPLERRIEVRKLVLDSKRRMPFSPIVITPNELKHRLAIADPFYLEILNRGKVLYAKE